jgi:transglutaminase-like putative cysteine protease
MQRRDFLKLATALPLLSAAPRLMAETRPDAAWRTFELTYDIDASSHPEGGRLWLPLPDHAGDYQRVIGVLWDQSPIATTLAHDPVYGAPILTSTWEPGQAQPIRVKMTIATRNRSMPAPSGPFDPKEAALYLQPTEHMPTDGIVAETARNITQGIASPDEKARAIYEWIVDNTFREPSVRGCGMGNIKSMLETGNLGGKCADINSLFVGLARASGIPAREMYGVRVAESAQFACLGKLGDVSKAQHCRAEYFSERYGWVPVDPADVRKAVLEAKLPLNDPNIVALRNRLFGFWEMNWVAFNHARDFELDPKASQPLPYLMYPYAELGETRLDGRDPSAFKFTLTSRELVTA